MVKVNCRDETGPKSIELLSESVHVLVYYNQRWRRHFES